MPDFTLPIGNTLRLKATLLDQHLQPIQGPVTWTADDSGSFSSFVAGLANSYSNHYCVAVTGKASGTVNMTATSGAVTQNYAIQVYPQSVASITIGLN